MSNTKATVRGSKSGLAPPGRRFPTDAEHASTNISSAVTSCASSTCCMGDSEAGIRMNLDDKYRKRLHQRKQKRLRNVLLVLFASLCLLLFTVYRTRLDGTMLERLRLEREGGHRHRRIHDSSLNDDHNKDDLQNDRSERRGFSGRSGARRRRGHGRGGRGRGWRETYGEHREESNDGDDDGDDEEEGESEEAVMQRRLLELQYLGERMDSNTNTTIRWADMSDVPPLPGRQDKSRNKLIFSAGAKKPARNAGNPRHKYRQFFQVRRPESTRMEWEKEYDAIVDKDPTARSNYVNYVHHKYNYPEKLMEPPKLGDYPYMRTYKELMDTWPQDEIDNPPDVLQEDLIHFDFNDPADMKAAVKFREAKLPFKLINVPEVMAATEKWTDEYIAQNFDTSWNAVNGQRSNGKCNEGPDNFFAFFNMNLWDVPDLGIPPTRDNDWTFERWAKHSHYADRVGLHPHKPHYYWQSGVPREERFSRESKWTFVSKDLPSFSATEDNFILFHAEMQKGIQCRFGERGITAANHYDSGRNMIAMITGAKRYILSPPRACKRLGVVSSKGHASFRHSMLNYGHIALMDSREDMPQEEREWMEMVGSAEAVSTVLKEGEILYVPTGWFHYITSLQKSAQCNVRSGPDMVGDEHWGGANEISADCFPHQ